MDSGTLADARIVAESAAFVCVKADADEREDLLQRFGVRDLPCLVFLPPDGGTLARMDNDYANGADKILDTMRAAGRTWQAFRKKQDAATARVAAAPDDPAAHRAQGDAWATVQDWERAVPCYEQALALAPAGAAVEYELEFVVFGDLTLGRNAEAAAAADRFLGTCGASRRLPQILYWRGLAARRLKDHAAARKAWSRVVTEFPQGKWADLARAGLAALEE